MPSAPVPGAQPPAPVTTTPAAGPGRRSRLWTVLVPAVFALAGLLFSASFQAARGSDLRSDRGLPGLIESANRDVAAKATQVAALQTEVEQLGAAKGDTRAIALGASARALAPSVGTAAVTGPALRVTLSDSSRSAANLPPSIRPDDLVVHQQDVQAVVNALWRGGAEAMMIQDQRVIATSAVRCVGNTLILHGLVYSPPFVVNAIGPVQAMRDELDADPQIAIYLQWVDAVGLGWEVTSLGNTRFAAYSGSVAQSSATAVR